MNILKRLFSGQASAVSSLPEVFKPVAYQYIPRVSLYCDSRSYQEVVAAYKALIPGEASSGMVEYLSDVVQHLNPLLELPEVRQWAGQINVWKAVASMINGQICGSFLRPISPEEAALVPRIGQRFRIETSLGLLTARRGDLIFFATGAFRNASLGPAFSAPDTSIDLDYVRNALQRAGWTVVELS
jgi:hypothetical protein